MKKVLLLVSIMVIAGFFLLNQQVFTNANQAPVAKSGAPGEQSCSQCHSGAAASGFVSLEFNSGDTSFVHSLTYPVKLTINHPAAAKFGFSLTALDRNNNKAGEIILVNPSITSLQQNGGREYVGHKSASSTNQWWFNWHAPDASSGIDTVTFYYSANAANGNSNTSGDAIYTASYTVPAVQVGIQEYGREVRFFCYANRESGVLNVKIISPRNESGLLSLFDLNGRIINAAQVNVPDGEAQIALPIFNLNYGIYILNLTTVNERYSVKVLI